MDRKDANPPRGKPQFRALFMATRHAIPRAGTPERKNGAVPADRRPGKLDVAGRGARAPALHVEDEAPPLDVLLSEIRTYFWPDNPLFQVRTERLAWHLRRLGIPIGERRCPSKVLETGRPDTSGLAFAVLTSERRDLCAAIAAQKELVDWARKCRDMCLRDVWDPEDPGLLGLLWRCLETDPTIFISSLSRESVLKYLASRGLDGITLRDAYIRAHRDILRKNRTRLKEVRRRRQESLGVDASRAGRL